MKTILIVDNDVTILKTLEKSLSESGYDIITASDGITALSAFQKIGTVDLVITDYQMPGMNGLELLAALKHLDPSVPAIMISLFARTDVYLKALSLDVAEFLEKPIQPQVLRRVVDDVLSAPL